MIRLDSTTRKLEVLLSGVVTAYQLPVVAAWSDATSSGYAGGGTPVLTNGVTPVTVVAAPAAGVVRDVDYLSIRNTDTMAATVTLRYNDNATTYELVKVLLDVGDHLSYTHAEGWRAWNSAGMFKLVGSTGTTGAIGPPGPSMYLDAEQGEDGPLGPPGIVRSLTPRVVTVADATSITANIDVTDICRQVNTQAGGTLTVNAPTGTLVDGQNLKLQIKCTNSQTFSWNAVFLGTATLTLPATTHGSTTTEEYLYVYDTAQTKWILSAVKGYY